MQQKKHRTRFSFFYFFIALWGVIIIRDLWNMQTNVARVTYSEFESLLRDNKIEEVFVTDTELRAHLKEAMDSGKKFAVTNIVEEDLAKKLSQYGVSYTRLVESTWLRDILSWVLPALVFFILWMFIMARFARGGGMGGSLMAIGKSKAKVYVEKNTKVSFSDVAGVDEAKAELIEVVNFLKDKTKFGRLGARIPKGILLVGPPGTGKTLLAKAVAGEAGVPFFSINGSEFVEMFVGVGAARVRDLFEQARTKAPCIIFVDELDALGRSRAGTGMPSGHDEKEQTLNQLLVELDGFDSSSGIVLLAATNRPEILDPALLRSGRFDRQVLVDRPDRKGRVKILEVHVRKVVLEDGVDLGEIAAITAGFTGADLENLVNEAALVATRRSAEAVANADFTEAMERIVAGLEKKNRYLNEKEKKIIAYHETGHALVANSLPGVDRVHKISIIPRGVGALGYTIQRPTEDRYLMTRSELLDKMAVLMGGRAAEKIIFDHTSTGAADDLDKATNIAREMVTKYGMDEKLGSVTYDDYRPTFLDQTSRFQSRNFSERTAATIDDAIRSLTEKSMQTAVEILTSKRAVLDRAASELLAKETLQGEDLAAIFAEG